MKKPVILDNQTAHYFKVASINFDKTYKVMNMRVKNGFSDRDLDFLLGSQPLFVKKAENPLTKERYNAKDTNYLLQIFNCKLPDIMVGKLPDLEWRVSIIVTNLISGIRTFEIYAEQHNDKTGLIENKLYKTFTELQLEETIGEESVATPNGIQEFLVDLLDTEYFNIPKTGLELFRTCSKHFNGHIKPTYIDAAMKAINKTGEQEIKIGKNEMRRFIYSKA